MADMRRWILVMLCLTWVSASLAESQPGKAQGLAPRIPDALTLLPTENRGEALPHTEWMKLALGQSMGRVKSLAPDIRISPMGDFDALKPGEILTGQFGSRGDVLGTVGSLKVEFSTTADGAGAFEIRGHILVDGQPSADRYADLLALNQGKPDIQQTYRSSNGREIRIWAWGISVTEYTNLLDWLEAAQRRKDGEDPAPVKDLRRDLKFTYLRTDFGATGGIVILHMQDHAKWRAINDSGNASGDAR